MGKKRIVKKSEERSSSRPTTPKSAEELAVQAKKAQKEGRAYIFSSYNNTMMTLTDDSGNALAQTSAGAMGFKGSRKSTPFAASKTAALLAQIAIAKGIGKIQIFVKGIGPGRDSAMRTLASNPLEILSIRDVTPVPHNGPTPRKPRRV